MVSVKFRVVAVLVLLFLFFFLALSYLNGLVPLVIKLGGKSLIIETIFASLILILSGISIAGLLLEKNWAKWTGISTFFIKILHFPIDWVLGRGGQSWQDIFQWGYQPLKGEWRVIAGSKIMGFLLNSSFDLCILAIIGIFLALSIPCFKRDKM